MKKLLYFAFLGVFAFFGCVTADTIDIKWGADNQTYTTTTCTVGGDVILPTPPTKRGYVFRGWQKDVFNRGKWANWAHVPSVSSEYPADYHGNHVPEQNDYMVVEDASGYASDFIESIFVEHGDLWRYVNVIINGVTTRIDIVEGDNYFFNNMFYLRTEGNNLTASLYSNYITKYNNTVYPAGTIIFQYPQRETRNLRTVYYQAPLSGTWRFVYDGVWETDGKNGWKPVEQIVNE